MIFFISILGLYFFFSYVNFYSDSTSFGGRCFNTCHGKSYDINTVDVYGQVMYNKVCLGEFDDYCGYTPIDSFLNFIYMIFFTVAMSIL
jgi:hypothetical protein